MADELGDAGERSHAIRTGTSGSATAPSPRADRSQLEIGATIDAESGCRYEILEKLGQGGMAEVYRARATKPTGLVLEVALKCLLGALGEDEESERQFIAEARVSSSLSHPHIARAQDLERIGGRLYLVLEYVDGVSLKAVIRAAAARKDPMPAEFVCYVGACIADALHHANTLPGPEGQPLGIVHRDLTGSNVMVTKRGIPKLLDFGIAYARLADRERTRTGVVRGTYSYLSPEQAAAGRAAKGEVDGRSDLFSLGLLLVELLTGKKVFSCEDEYLTVRAIEECSPARVQEATKELPPDLQRLCRRLLARRPVDRHQSGEDLALELRAILAEREPLYGPRECVVDLAALGLVPLREGETSSRSITGRTARRARARRFVLFVAGALLVGAGAGALGVGFAGRPSTAPAPETTPAASTEPRADVGPSAPPPPPVAAAGGEATAAAAPPTLGVPTAVAAPAAPPTSAEDLGWPDGVPVRKRQRPEQKPKVATAASVAHPAVVPAGAGPRPAAEAAAAPEGEKKAKGGVAARGALLNFSDRGIVANATATLPRGTVLRVRLESSITAAPGEQVEAPIVEEVAAGNVVVPRGARVTCRTGSTVNGRVNLACDSARAGQRVWTFSALALGERDRAGLRLDDGRVAAGTMFAVSVTASAMLE